MSSLIQDHGRSTLKLVQFKLFSTGVKQIDRKFIELILQELDPNFKVSSTDLLGEYGKNLIGDTLLHVAYAQGSIDALDFLIRKGADFNVKDQKGNTVLHKAFYDFMPSRESFRWDFIQNYLYTKDKRSQFITSILSAQVEYKNTENPSNLDGLTHFHVACATNNVEAVKFFLRSGVSVDQVITKAISELDFTEYTGLHFAARFGCLRVIEILLKHGANGNSKDAKGRTPLYIALERNIGMIDSAEKIYEVEDIEENEQVIQLFIDHNCIKNILYLILYIASSLQSTSMLQNYLSQDIDVNQCISMDSRVRPGYTALHFAAHVNVKTVKLLMTHGGNIEAKDANEVTPFDLCVKRYGVKDIVDIICLVPKWKNIVLSDDKTKLTDLLLAFEDSEKIQNFLQKSDNNVELFVPSNSPLWSGFSVLHIAVLLSERKKCKSDYEMGYFTRAHFQPDFSIITEILKQGADVTTKDSRNWTPIHFAFQLRREKVVDLLLQYHHRMQNCVDDENLSHLHIACSVKNEIFVERLLWNNVDVNIPYKGELIFFNVSPGSTPLHIALFDGQGKIAKMLLKFGADLHIPDDCSFTPLHYSMYDNCSTEMGKKIFLSSNLTDHVVEKVGLSYLHVACFLPNVEAVKKLLDLGVNVNQVVTVKNLEEDSDYWNIWNLQSRNGDIPLHTVMRSLHRGAGDVIRLLIERGGDIFARNAKGESPLENILDYRTDEYTEALVAILKRDVELRRRVEMETGVTLLHVACLLDGIDLIKDLLEDGADVTAQIPLDKRFWAGYTPLHVAYEKLCSPMGDNWNQTLAQLSLLLKYHKNFHVSPTIATGISHFHIACHLLKVDVVENFLEHDVDVNMTIDLFYNADIAGCSPLLLATRTAEWRANDSAEASAKLRIVELLIKKGARVNVEDIDGNTSAHYAAFCRYECDNYLKLLADNGADVNTRNVRGKTPLELFIGKGDLKFEDTPYFIACGCIFNEFTLDTEEGYIALVYHMLSQKNMESLLEEAFAKYPESMKSDRMNRTAIHNLVSTEFYEGDEKEVAALVDIMMRFDFDADDQDSIGRTALHLSARFRNNIGTEAMLLVGADFSITDQDGKPPLAYIFEPCLCKRIDGDDHEDSEHHKIFNTFMIHVRKLQMSDLAVDELNQALYRANEMRIDPALEYEILADFPSEYWDMAHMEIESYPLLLIDFMYEANFCAVLDYPRMSEEKCRAIDKFFEENRSYFRNRFSNVVGIFQLQYRQAVLRRKMIDAAKDSLSVLARFHVPDICSDIILRFLENSELRKLIASTS